MMLTTDYDAWKTTPPCEPTRMGGRPLPSPTMLRGHEAYEAYIALVEAGVRVRTEEDEE